MFLLGLGILLLNPPPTGVVPDLSRKSIEASKFRNFGHLRISVQLFLGEDSGLFGHSPWSA